MAVRESVGDYSWKELSAIAEEIAAVSDDASALEIAGRYHLVNAEGKLDGSQSKEIVLADGTVTHALVAGFRHDEKAGGGKTGITFVLADAVDQRAMNNNAGFDERSESDGYDVAGGWIASEMRAWLNNEFVDELPTDLRASLQSVEKTSVVVPEFLSKNVDDNELGGFSDETMLSTAIDLLWLPAVCEVGDPGEDGKAAEERAEWVTVLQGEGSQYQLFSDADENGELADVRKRPLVTAPSSGPCRWWLRSAEDSTFADVREDGALDRMQDILAAHPLGVVPCFAL